MLFGVPATWLTAMKFIQLNMHDRPKAAETGDNFVNVIEEADLNSNNVTQGMI